MTDKDTGQSNLSGIEEIKTWARTNQSGLVIDEHHPFYEKLPDVLKAGVIVDFTGNITPLQRNPSENQA